MLTLLGAAQVARLPLASPVTEEPAVGRDCEPSAALDARLMVREMRRFAQPRLSRSLWELAATVVPFLILCGLMLFSVSSGHLLALALTPPAGLFLLRLFLIQHDCGHGAFLPTRSGNDWLGRALGVFTLTPYDCWRRSHALHHAGTGNLDARGFGDIDTLTVREFEGRSRWGKLLYRIYRHPMVLLGFGPAYLFLLRHRLPIGLMKAGRIYWASALATNLVTAILIAAMSYGFGVATVGLVFLPVLLVAASVGVWLFYIQHQFEEAYWDQGSDWAFHEAALQGSSYLDLIPVFRWFTANIGIHHVHHLASRIPFYRLPEVLTDYPHLKDLNRFTAFETFSTLRLTLWDEDRRRLVGFPVASPARERLD